MQRQTCRRQTAGPSFCPGFATLVTAAGAAPSLPFDPGRINQTDHYHTIWILVGGTFDPVAHAQCEDEESSRRSP
ncbi:hypothetical protein BDN72DRAFT_832749 [Pluteus cervinus]|uniref:Uncharacterized protein n=1 Tax=Pluteus cervinus TaxID=181527 RepID=A0ACD3BAK1_9AGAR|nr:hypothetical protein BDN72DRAFT_832749 [Pluteus cervinus]